MVKPPVTWDTKVRWDINSRENVEIWNRIIGKFLAQPYQEVSTLLM